jgi:capsule biosynthesis phosphatase
MRFVLDLDGTLCEQIPMGGDYSLAKPKNDVICKANELFDSGHTIIIYTARGMFRHNGRVTDCLMDFFIMTTKWLKDNGVKYHELQFGKPAGDFYIDDKAMTLNDFKNRNF